MTIAAIDDGRLDAKSLGQSLRIAWQLRIETWAYHPINDPLPGTTTSVGFVKSTRWAKVLGDVAAASQLHSRLIARTVEHVLADEATTWRTTSSLIPLLELVREASVKTGRAVSGARRPRQDRDRGQDRPGCQRLARTAGRSGLAGLAVR